MREISDGIASAAEVLGDPNAVAPFFRVPYLDPTWAVENYALQRGLTIWSVDLFVSDWKNISAEQDCGYRHGAPGTQTERDHPFARHS